MKRLHVHIAVDDLQHSVGFYSRLFAAEPAVLKQDYAKWMIDDPCVNLAISARGAKVGIEHLGIQSENGDELRDMYDRLAGGDQAIAPEGETVCCYAQSERGWVADPSGVPWEIFRTVGQSAIFGATDREPVKKAAKACCAKAKVRVQSIGCC